MAKSGQAKNTKNKAKHAKLMVQKKNKLKAKKAAHLKHIKSIIQQQKEQLD